MSHLYNAGYAVVSGTTDPNSITQLQSGHTIKLAVSEDGTTIWKFLEGNPLGEKWKPALPDNVALKDSNNNFGVDQTFNGFAWVKGWLYHNDKFLVLNKAGDGFVEWATRNTSGSETVIDLSNIGSITTNSTATFGGNLTIGKKLSSSEITTGNNQLLNSSSSVVYVGNPLTQLSLESSSVPTIYYSGSNKTIADREWVLDNFSELVGDNVAFTNVDNDFSTGQTINDSSATQLTLVRSSAHNYNTSIKFVQNLGDAYFGVSATTGNLSFNTSADFSSAKWSVTKSGTTSQSGGASFGGLVSINSFTAYGSQLDFQTSLNKWSFEGGETGYSSTSFVFKYNDVNKLRFFNNEFDFFAADIKLNGSSLATQTWVNSQGFLTSETDSQTISNSTSGQLSISGGNTINLSYLKNSVGITGTSTDAANYSFLEFNESDGTTRQGYIGFGSNGNSNLYIYNQVANTFLGLDDNKKLSYNGSIFELSTNSSSSDIAKIILKNTDISVVDNQELSTIEFYNSDADGGHISAYIKNIAKETYGRQGKLSFGVATTNSTNAVEVGYFDENSSFHVVNNVTANSFRTTTTTDDYSFIYRDGVVGGGQYSLYVQNSNESIAKFLSGSSTPGGGTTILDVTSNGVNVGANLNVADRIIAGDTSSTSSHTLSSVNDATLRLRGDDAWSGIGFNGTGTEGFLFYNSTSQYFQFTKNTDFLAGIDVNGNINTTGINIFKDSGSNEVFHQFESFWNTSAGDSTATVRFDVNRYRWYDGINETEAFRIQSDTQKIVSSYDLDVNGNLDVSGNVTATVFEVGSQDLYQANGNWRTNNGLETLGDLRSYSDLIVSGTGTFSGKVFANADLEVGGKILGKSTDWTKYEIAQGSNFDHIFTTRTNVGAGLERLRITGGAVNGLVSVKNADLEVNGSGTFSGDLEFTQKSNTIKFGSSGDDSLWGGAMMGRVGSNLIISDYSGVQLGGYNGTAYGARMTVLGTGNVGIGTTSPATALQVNGTITSTGALTAYTSVPSINIGHNGSSAFIAATSGSGADTSISFSVGNNNEKMRINTLGNVGIGTTSPDALLHVQGDNHLQVGSTTGGRTSVLGNTRYTDGGALNYRSYWSYDSYWDDTTCLWNAKRTTLGRKWKAEMSYHDDHFQISRQENVCTTWANSDWSNFFTINSSGNVGIGTTSPSEKLDVLGNIKASGNRVFGINSTDTSTELRRLNTGNFISLYRSNVNVANIGASSQGIRINSLDGGFITVNSDFVNNTFQVNDDTSLAFDINGTTGKGRFLKSLDVTGNLSVTDVADFYNNINIGNGSKSEYALQIGQGRTGNGFAYIDLIGDATHTDYGFRILRGNTGANATTSFTQEGTGNVVFSTGGGKFDFNNSVDIAGNLDVDSGDIFLGYTGTTYSHAVIFKGASSSVGEVGLRANGEGFEIYEPEDGNRLWVSISDNLEGNSTGFKILSPNGMVPVLTSANFVAGTDYVVSETNSFLGDGGSGNTHPGTNRVIYTGQLNAGGSAVGLPAVDNSNSILTINRHSGNYNSQLGFSSNGNMYYRSYSNEALNSTKTWRQVWDSGNLTNVSQLNNDANYLTSYTETDTLQSVTARGSSTTVFSTFSGGISTGEVRTANGQHLVINAGESHAYATGQTNEYVYVNAESGLEVNFTPDNWNSGWAGREAFRVNSTDFSYKGHLVYHNAYHPEADKWTTARTITLSGDLTGSVSIDGSSNVTLSAQVGNDSHSHSNYTERNSIDSLGVRAFTGGTDPNITTTQLISEMEADGAFDSYSSVFKTSWSYAGNYNLTDAGGFVETAGTSWITWTDNSSDTTRGNITALAIAPNTGGSAGGVFIYNDQGAGYNPGWREVWTSETDGSGSGLDADLLDGQHGSYYYPASNPNSYTSFTANQSLNTTDSPTFNRLNTDEIFGVGNTLNLYPAGYGAVNIQMNSSGININGTTVSINGVNTLSYITNDTQYYLFTNDVELYSDGQMWLGSGDGGTYLVIDDTLGRSTFNSNVYATNFVLSSDERLKENVHKVQDETINVNWKTFNLIEKPEDKRYGVIAQELEESHPEFVDTDEEGFKSVKYIDLLIAKMAEMEETMKAMQSRIEQLENR